MMSPSREAEADSPSGIPVTRSTSALSFQIVLNDSVYLPGQPVYVFATTRNLGDSTFQDFGGVLGPPLGLQLVLYRGRQKLPDHYLKGTWVFAGAGPDLRPGERFCSVANLFEGYGKELPIDVPNGQRYRGAGGLPPGNYRVVAYVRPHVLGEIRDFPEAEAKFTVLTPSHLRAVDERALRMLERARGNWPNERTPENWNQVRRGGLELSRYVAVLAATFLPDERAIRMGEFASEMARSGLSPLEVAGLLSMREYQLQMDPDAERAWLRAIGRMFPDSSLQCLLRSWQARAALNSEFKARAR